MNKWIVIVIGLVAMNVSAQQQQLSGNTNSNMSLNNQSFQQRQNYNVVYASNNVNNHVKVRQTNNRRMPIQVNSAVDENPQIQPLVMNNDVQQLQINIPDNNIGNQMDFVQQKSAVELPVIQTGNSNMETDFKIDIKIPNIKFNKRAVKRGASSNSVRHNLFQFEKKLKRVNRKLLVKLNGNKKLRLKVDNCFKW